MSWVTLDDAAPTHRKQLAAGPRACWLWTCGLAYCDRQETKDGFIPDAVVKLLYPGLGAKDADALVRVGLWVRTEGGFRVHDYLHWRDRRFAQKQAGAGAKGGAVRSDAKRRAALDREAAKRHIPQAQTTSESTSESTSDHKPDHKQATTSETTSLPIRTDPIRTDLDPSGSETEIRSESAPAREAEPGDDPGAPTTCPLDLAQKLEKNGMTRQLAERLEKPIEQVRDTIGRFVGYWTIGKGMGQRRTAWAGRCRQWVLDEAGKPGGMRPPGAIEHERQGGYQVSASTAALMGGLVKALR